MLTKPKIADFLEGAEPRQLKPSDHFINDEKGKSDEIARKIEISNAKDKQIVSDVLTENELKVSVENLRKEVLKQRFMGEELNFKVSRRLLTKQSMVFSYQLTAVIAAMAFLISWMFLGRK